MDRILVVAFERSRQGYSADRVVADPCLNEVFLSECSALGLSDSAEMLNKRLLNARKGGSLSSARTTCRTTFRNESEYAFASEIAIRFLERRDGVSLDEVICSPTCAVEFDAIAARICPGYSSVEYRWAALNLRKKRKLRPELVAQLCPASTVKNISVPALDLEQIRDGQGVYIFFNSRETLYVGETTKLRKRLAKHLEHSDNKGLARWLWEHGADDLHLEIHILPIDTPTRARKALEAELIQTRSPVFNVKGK